MVFNLQGLSDPLDAAFAERARRFAGFYLNEDPGATAWSPTKISFRLALDWMSNLADRPPDGGGAAFMAGVSPSTTRPPNALRIAISIMPVCKGS